MKLRHRVVTLLTLALLVPAAALANRSGTTVNPVDPGQVHPFLIGTPLTSGAPCQLGEIRPTASTVSGYLAPPDDAYFTLLNPAACASCTGPGGVIITTAHVVLGFNPICTISVEVSIVSDGGVPGCPEPNVNDVLCGPVTYALTPAATGTTDFSLALPQACCITQNAFLKVKFLTNGTCNPPGGNPSIGAAATPCNTCFSYNDNPAFGFVDICTDFFWPSAQAGNPKMYVDADCCNGTSDLHGSWGRLKTLYR
ncbi:MAG TPA: hypothetical protein VEY91_06435 [Candidatus Limnocylindria bacterium]|nr:hypothetical protein [Candidatus Limnocylindria bacterium]